MKRPAPHFDEASERFGPRNVGPDIGLDEGWRIKRVPSRSVRLIPPSLPDIDPVKRVVK